MLPDPYAPPRSTVAPPRPVRGAALRVLGWALLMYVVVGGVAMAMGIAMASWYGDTLTPGQGYLARRSVIGLVVFLLYLAFLRGARQRPGLQAALLFFTFQALEHVVDVLAFGGGPADIDVVAWLRNAGACTLAVGLDALRRKRLPHAPDVVS